MRVQTIAVILGVALLGIGPNDATAGEDWVCAPSKRIREIFLNDNNDLYTQRVSDVYKWIGMCYAQPEGECEEGWGEGKCKWVDAYDTVAPLYYNACECTSEDNDETICLH